MTDTEWLELLSASPQKAHYELIGAYGSYVYTIVLSKLKNCASREEIEDCVSDVFVEVFCSADKFSSEKGTLKGFIATIAKRTAINAFQKLTYRRNITMSIEEEGVTLPPSPDDPEGETQKKMRDKRLWEIVDSLGEPDTSIIIYQYYYDLKVNEIAERLSMTSGAVQKRSIRARERIRNVLVSENYI